MAISKDDTNKNLTTSTESVAIEQALIGGDLSRLSPEQRVIYYRKVCQSLGLNELTQPFNYITLNGKLTLYAKRDATDQLRKVHKISVKISSREKIGDVFQVTAQATNAEGRTDESIGAVTIGTLKGDALANALMKAETKAKRRVTLSICGLGILDETEIETIPNQKSQEFHKTSAPQIPGMSAAAAEQLKKDIEDTKRKLETTVIEEGTPDEIFPFEETDEHGVSYISKAQATRLFAIQRASRWTEEELRSLILKVTGQGSTSHIPWTKYDEIWKYMEANRK